MQRVVVMSRSLPHHAAGGMEVAAWDLSCQLRAAGASDVTVLTTHIEGRPSVFFERGVKVVSLAQAPSRRYSMAWWRHSREYFARELTASTTAVLSVSAGGYGLIPIINSMPNISFILQAHGTSIGEVLSKVRTRRAIDLILSARNLAHLPRDMMSYRSFDAVVAVGPTVFRDMTSAPIRWFLPRDKVHCIPNGIDTEVFAPAPEGVVSAKRALGWDPSEYIILSVSRLHAQKGVADAIRGFARYANQDPTARFVIVGDGPDRAPLVHLTDKLGLGRRIVFTGDVPRDKIPDYLKAADVFSFTTSHREGLPLNLLEALAAGLPCVVSDHLSDTIEVGNAVTYVRPHRHDEIAQAFAHIRSRCSGPRRSALPQEFTLAHSARSYLALMARLESHKTSRPSGAVRLRTQRGHS